MTITSATSLETGHVRRRQRATIAPYLFIAPFFALFLTFFIAPIFYAGYLSVFVDRIIGGVSFVGLENYGRVLTDPDFWSGLKRVVVYGLVQVPIMLLLALTLALLLDAWKSRGRAAMQLTFFLPFAIPSVVAALMWGYMYGANFGVLTQIAEALGLGNPRFLSPTGILPSIGNIAVWATAGANMVILYSALRSIPAELLESSRLDGANEWQVTWHIKLPLLRSTLLFTATLAIIAAMQLFTEPQVLQPITPGSITNAFTPNVYAYTLIAKAQQYNLAAAVAFTLTAVILIVTGAFLLVTRKKTR